MTALYFASDIHHIGLWLTVRHVIVMLSVLAAAVNITGIVPQLLTMLRQRSSRGQSPLGWSLSATCSLSLLFVNAVGYHALVLACGNLLSASGCLTAVFLARRYRSRTMVSEEVLQVLADAPEQVLSELASPELHALTETVLEEQHRRTGEAIPDTVVADLAADDLHALTGTVLEEHHRRTGEPVPAEAIAEMHTTEFQALADTVLKEQSRRTGELALALDAA
jgi:hypothetical protein